MLRSRRRTRSLLLIICMIITVWIITLMYLHKDGILVDLAGACVLDHAARRPNETPSIHIKYNTSVSSQLTRFLISFNQIPGVVLQLVQDDVDRELVNCRQNYCGLLTTHSYVDSRTPALVEKFMKPPRKAMRLKSQCRRDTAVVPYLTDVKPRARVLVRLVTANFTETCPKLAVSVITQVSYERAYMLPDQIRAWDGPFTAVVQVPDHMLCHFVNKAAEWMRSDGRSCMSVIVVVKSGTLYPINWLRNIGLYYTLTPYVLLLDADFIPSESLYAHLRSEILGQNNDGEGTEGTHPNALILPAFETFDSTILPRTKSELKESLERNLSSVFHIQLYEKAHYLTNYSLWTNANWDYPINPSECFGNYEPYIVVKKSDGVYLPEVFLSYFRNKVTLFSQLCNRGYKFVVSSSHFVLHRPHPTTFSAKIYNESDSASKHATTVKKCSSLAWHVFKDYVQKYEKDKGG